MLDSWSLISATKYQRCQSCSCFLAKQHKYFTQKKWTNHDGKWRWQKKKACSRRHEQTTIDVFITTGAQAYGMHIAHYLNPMPTMFSLVGGTELSDAENLLPLAKF